MTDPGCAGCEWAKGRFLLFSTELEGQRTRFESKCGGAETVANLAMQHSQKTREEFAKVKMLTMDSINSANGAINAVDEIKADNLDFKKSVSRELRGIMLSNVAGSAIGSGVMIAALAAVAKFIFHV